ncbi:hypothetical protein SAMN05192529_13146 [Arachidicoccus rhizosphaerae]|uniref:Uncharacterized protein n=2 Tax=Arachidicoccus rhizosphaerae TaxID=551991 RepID=A0A1H4CGP2_9BACT|nr:hypothetical protein SAMN05192529_13146 [Arachidicoccus rhizosphaerae]
MAGLASEMAECPPRKRKNQIRKELAYLKDVLLLLEVKPKKSYLIAEERRISGKIGQIERNYWTWIESIKSEYTPRGKREYEKERGVPALMQHLKNLRFIID